MIKKGRMQKESEKKIAQTNLKKNYNIKQILFGFQCKKCPFISEEFQSCNSET